MLAALAMSPQSSLPHGESPCPGEELDREPFWVATLQLRCSVLTPGQNPSPVFTAAPRLIWLRSIFVGSSGLVAQAAAPATDLR